MLKFNLEPSAVICKVYYFIRISLASISGGVKTARTGSEHLSPATEVLKLKLSKLKGRNIFINLLKTVMESAI